MITNYDQIQTFLTTPKNCDCGSVLGKIIGMIRSEPDWKKERKKLERKQFSKRRIELLMEQNQNKFKIIKADEIQTEIIETDKWARLLNNALLKRKMTEIGILHHQFSGELQSERFRIESEKINSAEEMDLDFLMNIKENELNWFKL